ncbi:ATP-binding cassette domain-containing protein [Herbidospora sp. NEAU-GS84]|uniref:ATP-binding cassette domain-containing protein n=1 Tax=Herbidospora solisilvae TaxID=2696284 RepID=A0A7C9NEK6_9ACTN|nr:ABC transporter ATP-binding protein [Herbidospora solisilvae]NAS20332.1 ATP-binding cassette domain-containing protein [Herbidospora solisilvae]
MTDAIVIRGLRKAYRHVLAVDDLSLTVPQGQRLALLGPNGAGKTTTISVLLGLLAPDAGATSLFGRDSRSAVNDGLVGVMQQEIGLPPRVTVRELVRFARAVFPAPLPYDEIVAQTGLTGLDRARVDRLSGGQRQRVRFAMALAGDPKLLVLDEPTAGLDVEARRDFWDGLSTSGRTVVFSSHHLDEADRFADRIVVLNRGRLVADGTSAEIKRGGDLEDAFLALISGRIA